MEDANLDPEELMVLAAQMVTVLEEKAFSEVSFLDELRADLFHTSLLCQEDHVELVTRIEDWQRQIRVTEHALQEAQNIEQSGKSEAELRKRKVDLLERERTLKVQERSLQNMLDNLSMQREALPSQKEMMKKLDSDIKHNQMALSFCASASHMIASDGGNNGVAGILVDSEGCVVDTFGFSTENLDAFDISEKLWDLCMNN